MSLRRLILLTVLAAGAQSAAMGAWWRAASGNVEVYSDAGRGMAAKVLAETTAFYGACARVNGYSQDAPAMTLVYFADEADFRRMRGDGFSKGFFQRTGDANWVVVHGGPDAVRRLRHELVHVINDQAGLSGPVWMVEGLAEYYSGLDVAAAGRGETRVAAIPLLIRLAAGDGGWFGENDLDDGRQARDGGLFYARAWALVNWLMREGGADGVRKLAKLLQDGTDQERAFRLVYGVGMGEMIGRARIGLGYAGAAGGWVERGWPAGQAVEEAVTDFDAEVLLGELARASGADSESERRYEKGRSLAGRGRDRPGRLALLALRRGDTDEALALMETAAASGSTDARMWFEYAMLMREKGAGKAKWVGALKRSVELDPGRGEAWFVLGTSTTGEESVQLLKRAVETSPGRTWAWEAYGRALLSAGRKEEARAAAEEALRWARRGHQRSMAEGLLAEIDAPPPEPGREGPDVVTPESWTKSEVAARVEGRLVAVDCAGVSPVLVIETGGGRVRVSVKRMFGDSVQGGGTFACGVQGTVRTVVAGHDGKPDAELRTAGDLRRIEDK